MSAQRGCSTCGIAQGASRLQERTLLSGQLLPFISAVDETTKSWPNHGKVFPGGTVTVPLMLHMLEILTF